MVAYGGLLIFKKDTTREELIEVIRMELMEIYGCDSYICYEKDGIIDLNECQCGPCICIEFGGAFDYPVSDKSKLYSFLAWLSKHIIYAEIDYSGKYRHWTHIKQTNESFFREQRLVLRHDLGGIYCIDTDFKGKIITTEWRYDNDD